MLAFLQNLTAPNAEPLKTGISWVDIWILGVNAPAIERLYRVSAIILLITCLRAGLNYVSQIFTQFSEINLVHNLRQRIFEQLEAQTLSCFAEKRSGDLINTLTSEMTELDKFLVPLLF